MTADDILGWIVKGLVGILTAAVVALTRSVLGNRERVKILEEKLAGRERVKVLEVKVEELEERLDAAITKEDIRELLDEALARRDKVAVERRREWEKRHLLEIKSAVQEGVAECRRFRDSGSGTGRVDRV